jgi:arsenite methyltransferase
MSQAADYGLDAPHLVKRMFSRAGWMIAFALAIFFINRAEYPDVSARLLAVLGAIGLGFLAAGLTMVWSSRTGKLQLRDRLLDSLNLKGDEKILDAGCGRGLLLIGAAKRLKSGKATGIDIWSGEDLSGNSADAVRANAKIEGVADRVRIENGDVRKLVYPDNHYDAVISSTVIHNIPDRAERDQAIREIYRVLKPGGQLAVFDIFRTGEYAEVLRELGAQNVTLSPVGWLWGVPSRTVTARK